MADRVEIRSVTCPAATAQTAAIETDLTFPAGVVREVEIIIPSGHAGVTGIALAQAHQIVIPASGNTWIISDDEEIKWPLDNFLNSGSWSAFTYNKDATNPHSWYLRFLIDEIGTTVASTQVTPLSAAVIIGAGDTTTTVDTGF